MAEHQQGQQQAQQHGQQVAGGIKNVLPDKGPSGSQVLAVATLLPVGGILLFLSGITLTGTLIGLAVCTPLFVIFSPVLFPAMLVIGLSVAGFLTSGALGVTGLTSLSWILNYVRGAGRKVPEQMEHARRRMAEAGVQVGHKTREVGHGIQSRAQEAART